MDKVGSGEKIFTRDFLLLFLSLFLNAMTFYMLMPTLPVFVFELTGSERIVGEVGGSFAWAIILSRPMSGYLVDRFGRKAPTLISFALFVSALFLYGFASSIMLLLAVRFVHGISWGIVGTSTSTLVADILPENKKGQGMSFYTLSISLAMSIGPMIGLYLQHSIGFSRMITLGSIMALSAFMLILPIHYPPATSIGTNKPNLRSFIEPSLLPLSLVNFILTIAYAGIMTFASIFSVAEGYNNAEVFFFLFAVGTGLTRIFMGGVIDKKGPAWTMIPGIAIMCAAFMGIAYLHNSYLFLLSGFLMGLGIGMSTPTFAAIAIMKAPPERRGVAMATIYMAFDLGMGGGSILSGMMAEKFSYRSLFIFDGWLSIIPLALLIVWVFPYLDRMKNYST